MTGIGYNPSPEIPDWLFRRSVRLGKKFDKLDAEIQRSMAELTKTIQASPDQVGLIADINQFIEGRDKKKRS
jgi:hypothetical protein